VSLELKCLGHPLSELSRSFKPDFSVCQVYDVDFLHKKYVKEKSG
jgi:hypothetical protein